jgi:hypothetical protein
MKLRIAGVLAASAAAAAWVSACSVEQPSIGCPVQSISWSVRYSLVSGTGACSTLTGDLIGIERQFNPETNKSKITLRPTPLGVLGARDAVNPAQAIGDLPDDNSPVAGRDERDAVCAVPTLSKAEKHAPVGTLPDGGVNPPSDISYEFSNLVLSASPKAPGNQMTADLTYTEDGCTATYKAVGLWPAHGCETDDECAHYYPDFPVKCDLAAPEINLDGLPGSCVLTETELPALK